MYFSIPYEQKHQQKRFEFEKDNINFGNAFHIHKVFKNAKKEKTSAQESNLRDCYQNNSKSDHVFVGAAIVNTFLYEKQVILLCN